MVERPRVGKEYAYQPSRGKPVPVRFVGYIRTLLITEGVLDGQRRDVAPKCLFEVEG